MLSDRYDKRNVYTDPRSPVLFMLTTYSLRVNDLTWLDCLPNKGNINDDCGGSERHGEVSEERNM